MTTTPRLAMCLLAALILSGCSHDPEPGTSTAPKPTDHSSAPAPPEYPTTPPLPQHPTTPIPTHTAPPLPTPPPLPPPPKAATSELREGGSLGERHTRIVAEASQGGHEIAFIGDSITEGWAGAGKDAWANVWAPHHAINCGIGGDRTQHVLGRLDNGLLDALAAPNNNIKWVVLMIGTNNVGGDSAADITAGIEAIVHKLRTRLPNAQIALFAVFPRGQFPNPQRDTINAINTRLIPIAAHDAKSIHLIDIGAKFLTPTGELPAALMPDFLHLSPAGYKIWSDELANVIK